MPGAFDYGAKNAQQRVALLGKDITSARAFFTSSGPVGAKTYIVTPVAGVFKTALSISGSGALNFCAAFTAGAAVDTIKLKITVDSRVIFNGSLAIGAGSYQGFVAVGTLLSDITNSTCSYVPQRIPFEKSLLIECGGNGGQSVAVSTDYEVNV